MLRTIFHQLITLISLAALFAFPQLSGELSASGITLARFIGFGLLSLAILPFRIDTLKKATQADIKPLFMIGLSSNVICYLSLVLAIRILGCLPAFIFTAILALLFSPRARDVWLKVMTLLLILSITLRLAGQPLVPQGIQHAENGLLAILIAVVSWHWGNTRMTQLILARPDLDASDRFLLTGLFSLLASILLIPAAAIGHELSLSFALTGKKEFWLAALILGSFCTLAIRLNCSPRRR